MATTISFSYFWRIIWTFLTWLFPLSFQLFRLSQHFLIQIFLVPRLASRFHNAFRQQLLTDNGILFSDMYWNRSYNFHCSPVELLYSLDRGWPLSAIREWLLWCHLWLLESETIKSAVDEAVLQWKFWWNISLTLPFRNRAFTFSGWHRRTLSTETSAVSYAAIFICAAAKLL